MGWVGIKLTFSAHLNLRNKTDNVFFFFSFLFFCYQVDKYSQKEEKWSLQKAPTLQFLLNPRVTAEIMACTPGVVSLHYI